MDAFDAATLTHRNLGDHRREHLRGPAGDVAATDVLELATVSVVVRDQADSDGTNDATNSAALTVEAADDPYGVLRLISPIISPLRFKRTKPPSASAEDDGRLCDEAVEPTRRQAFETELEVVATAGGDGCIQRPVRAGGLLGSGRERRLLDARVGYIRRERPRGRNRY